MTLHRIAIDPAAIELPPTQTIYITIQLGEVTDLALTQTRSS
jgi:hypothetical protein